MPSQLATKVQLLASREALELATGLAEAAEAAAMPTY